MKRSKSLITKRLLNEVFDRVELKTKSNPKILYSGKEGERGELLWMLFHKNSYIRGLLDAAKKFDIELEPLKLIKLKQAEKTRDIYVSPWLDRVYVMALAQRLSRAVQEQLSTHVYSFQKGLGPYDALGALSSYLKDNHSREIYVLRRDISAYGDSIPQDILRKKLQAILPDDEIDRLYSVLRCPYHADSLNEEVLAQLCVGIPSGSPLVPPIENFYLGDLDAQLGSVSGTFYMRYGDDFLFACTSHHEAESASKKIEDIVFGLGLKMKDSKKLNYLLRAKTSVVAQSFESHTRIPYQAVSSFEVLGKRVRSGGNLGPKKKKLLQLNRQMKIDLQRMFFVLKNSAYREDKTFVTEFITKSLVVCMHNPIGVYQHALLRENQNFDLVMQFDANLRKLLLKMISQELGLPKRQAWRLFRKLKISYFSREYRRKSAARGEGTHEVKKTA